MTDEAATGLGQTAASVTGEQEVTKQNLEAAQGDMFNEGAPVVAAPSAVNSPEQPPLESGNSTSGLVDAQEKAPAPEDADTTAAAGKVETTLCTLTMEKFIREDGEGLHRVATTINDAGDILLVFLDESDRPRKIFAVMGEVARNVTRLAA